MDLFLAFLNPTIDMLLSWYLNCFPNMINFFAIHHPFTPSIVSYGLMYHIFKSKLFSNLGKKIVNTPYEASSRLKSLQVFF